MKHKAQESLDYIAQIVLDEIADGYTEPRTVHDFYYGQYCELEDLINCQLTVEEMKFAANCLYAAGFVDENIVKQILGKFQNQKEMWVSE